jgi:hypothetical protein
VLKKLSIFSLLVFILSGCASFSETSYRIKINDINKKIAKGFPIRKKITYGVLKLEKPRVVASSKKNRLHIGISISLTNMMFGKFSAKILLSGKIFYKASTREFFIRNPDIESFSVLGRDLPSLVQNDVKNYLKSLAAKSVNNKVVYKAKKLSPGIKIKDIRIDNGDIVVSMKMDVSKLDVNSLNLSKHKISF